MYTACIVVATLFATGYAEPLVTAAAQLAPRRPAAGSDFVGYISENGGYSDPRTCDYPQTVSTSGSYVQCCPTTGSCPFYTSCSSNTLLASGTSVPCDVDTALTCNTGIVEPTVGASSGPSYLACWQTSLGSSAFTFVQNIGSATSAAQTGTTSAAVSGSNARSSASTSTVLTGVASSRGTIPSASSMSSTGSSSAASATSSAGSHMAVHNEFGTGFVAAALGFLMPVFF